MPQGYTVCRQRTQGVGRQNNGVIAKNGLILTGAAEVDKLRAAAGIAEQSRAAWTRPAAWARLGRCGLLPVGTALRRPIPCGHTPGAWRHTPS